MTLISSDVSSKKSLTMSHSRQMNESDQITRAKQMKILRPKRLWLTSLKQSSLQVFHSIQTGFAQKSRTLKSSYKERKACVASICTIMPSYLHEHLQPKVDTTSFTTSVCWILGLSSTKSLGGLRECCSSAKILVLWTTPQRRSWREKTAHLTGHI